MAQRYLEGMGKEKLHFSLLELAKCQKGPLGKSVSTHFATSVANNSQLHQKIPFVNLKTQLFSRGRHLFIIAFQEKGGHFSKILMGECLKRGKDALNWQNKQYNINLVLTKLTAPLEAEYCH